MAPKIPSRLFPVFNSSKSITSAVIDIIKVNNPPIPNEKKGNASKKRYGFPGINKNQSIIYPIIETDCDTIKAFFFPIFLDI